MSNGGVVFVLVCILIGFVLTVIVILVTGWVAGKIDKAEAGKIKPSPTLPPSPKPRPLNEYLFTEHYFAEYSDSNVARGAGEPWRIYTGHPDKPKIVGVFWTDTADNAQRLMDWLEGKGESV